MVDIAKIPYSIRRDNLLRGNLEGGKFPFHGNRSNTRREL